MNAALANRGPDPVERPAHYTRLDPQPLAVIEAWGLPFHEAQVVKYVSRAGHKGDGLTDLRKARVYLDRLIAHAETGEWPTLPCEERQPITMDEAIDLAHDALEASQRDQERFAATDPDALPGGDR